MKIEAAFRPLYIYTENERDVGNESGPKKEKKEVKTRAASSASDPIV